jgi:hypothetical protein
VIDFDVNPEELARQQYERKQRGSAENPYKNGEDQTEPPRPLVRERPPGSPYPVDELGEILGDAALAIHDRVQAPLAACAQSVLASTALSTQAHANVVIPIGGDSSRPLSIYSMSLLETGERKTAADDVAMAPIRQREKELQELYDKEKISHQNQKDAWDKAREAAKKNGNGDRDTIVALLEALGEAPVAPLLPIMTCDEPTYEGLCRLLEEGQPSIGLFSDEGGHFIGGHGMTQDAKLRTATGMSKVWDGKPIRRVRASGITILPGRRVSVHLLMQPFIADAVFNDQLLLNQGLLSRVLMNEPEPASGSRFQHDENENTARALAVYDAALLEILRKKLPPDGYKNNVLKPHDLKMSEKCKNTWKKFADAVERELQPTRKYATIKGFANKAPENAARIAGNLTLIRDTGAAELGSEELQSGIVLVQFYADEALRRFDGSALALSLQRAQLLLGWLTSTWEEDKVSLPDIYQRGPNSIRDKATAEAAVDVLEDHGWLTRIRGGAKVAGTQRRDAWWVWGKGERQ